jgi:shikimate dehydrogenase
MKRVFGLIGFPLSHSFSKKYFAEKFANEGIRDTSYENYPIEQIDQLPSLFENDKALIGLNVTIPYKESVLPYLDTLASDAGEIGAVNTIKRYDDGSLKGFNSDIYGFGETLKRFLPDYFSSGALVLGTGGASKAVHYVCAKMGLPVQAVSRRKGDGLISYSDINAKMMSEFRLIINTTPLGMHPDITQSPDLPYELLTPGHYLLDLIYNPEMTRFLSEGKQRGSMIKNGMEMLILQAEKSWEIWNNPRC